MLRPLLRFTVKLILKLLFRVEIHGMENYDAAGKRVLIVANHTSFLDPMLLWIFLPDDITFAINTHISERWWLKPFLGLSKVFRMDPTHPLSLKDLTHHLQHDTKTVIFPEGRITVTGTLMKIYDGTGMVADKSHAVVLPVRIEGAKYTHFSRLQNVVRLRWFPKITISILPPTQMRAPEHLRGKARRQYCGHILTDIMTDMMFKTSHYRRTIFSALLEARRIHGGKFAIADDLARKPVSYNTLIARTIALGNLFASVTEAGEHVGVMLPNSVNTLCVVLGLQLHQRIPAMLNFSTGSASMISACKTAEVKTVLTSRQFIDKAKLDEEAAHLAEHANLIYLEDLAAQVNLAAKLKALLLSHTTGLWYKSDHIDPEHPAVVLFTSGSEGTPKGVVLSYANILGNLKQLESVINFNPQDVVLNFLPMFHSFGFTVGSMLPVLNGMQAFFYPTPLHYAVIPEIAYEIKATVMFGTNTFLAAYGKKANPYDFFRMRYVGRRCGKTAGKYPRALGRQIRYPDPRRLRRHRNHADHLGQHPDELQGRHGRPLHAGHEISTGAGPRHSRRRPVARQRAEHHAGLSAGGEPRQTGAARVEIRQRLVRHRRHRLGRRGRLYYDQGPEQALCQGQRRNGVADRGRTVRDRSLAGRAPCRGQPARPEKRRTGDSAHHA